MGMDEADVNDGQTVECIAAARARHDSKRQYDCFVVGEGPTEKEYSIEKIEYHLA